MSDTRTDDERRADETIERAANGCDGSMERTVWEMVDVAARLAARSGVKPQPWLVLTLGSRADA